MEYEKEFKKLGKRYKDLRLRQEMVQEDVQEYDLSVRYYQQLETGRPHSLRIFFQLAMMFGMRPEELIKGIFDGGNGHRKKK